MPLAWAAQPSCSTSESSHHLRQLQTLLRSAPRDTIEGVWGARWPGRPKPFRSTSESSHYFRRPDKPCPLPRPLARELGSAGLGPQAVPSHFMIVPLGPTAQTLVMSAPQTPARPLWCRWSGGPRLSLFHFYDRAIRSDGPRRCWRPFPRRHTGCLWCRWSGSPRPSCSTSRSCHRVRRPRRCWRPLPRRYRGTLWCRWSGAPGRPVPLHDRAMGVVMWAHGQGRCPNSRSMCRPRWRTRSTAPWACSRWRRASVRHAPASSLAVQAEISRLEGALRGPDAAPRPR